MTTIGMEIIHDSDKAAIKRNTSSNPCSNLSLHFLICSTFSNQGGVNSDPHGIDQRPDEANYHYG
jgi:hypothetical protein